MLGSSSLRLVGTLWTCISEIYSVPKVAVLRQGAKSDRPWDGIFWFCSTDNAKRDNFFFSK